MVCYCLNYLRSAQLQHQTAPVMQAHHVTHILISYSKELQAYPSFPQSSYEHHSVSKEAWLLSTSLLTQTWAFRSFLWSSDDALLTTAL